jgi:Ig-like domain from next to BRCA1 gene
MRNVIVFMVLAFFLASCSALSTLIPSPTSARTPTPSMTAEPASSLTLAPSATLSLVPSPSTGASSAPSQTPLESGALDCALLMQTVRNGAHFKPGDQFSISWKVRNTGTAGWDSGLFDFTYIAGTKMYQYPLVHLQGTVDPGNISYLMADMRAPHNPGKYSTTWSLRQGDNYFCHVGLTIYVD